MYSHASAALVTSVSLLLVRYSLLYYSSVLQGVVPGFVPGPILSGVYIEELAYIRLHNSRMQFPLASLVQMLNILVQVLPRQKFKRTMVVQYRKVNYIHVLILKHLAG